MKPYKINNDNKKSYTFTSRSRCKYCGKKPKIYSFTTLISGFSDIKSFLNIVKLINNIDDKISLDIPNNYYSKHRIKNLRFLKIENFSFNYIGKKNKNIQPYYVVEFLSCECYYQEWIFCNAKKSQLPEIKNRKI